MRRFFPIRPLGVAILALAGIATSAAAESVNCRFDDAAMSLTSAGTTGHVALSGSGVHPARIARSSAGTTIRFDTADTRDTVDITPGGGATWVANRRDGSAPQSRDGRCE